MNLYPEIFAALAAEFRQGEVRFREGRNGGHYIKAPTAMARLDTVLGAANWWDAYHQVDEITVECSLTIRLPDGSTVTKQDVGIRKPMEPGKLDAGCSWKAAYSDALKRAAAKFGVARYLSQCLPADYWAGSEAAPERRPEGSPAPAARPTDRERLPSQARPSTSPEAEPMRQAGGAPRTGRALFAWCKDQEERYGVGLLKYLAGWGKLQEFPGRVVDWDADQAAQGHAEAARKLRSIEGGQAVGREAAMAS